ncbi:UNVERIFIED_CONTAM: hypothetical protein Sradi_3721700 [Sesamum radiatum]|uniref:Uncharacterized protein n=1 Tax=Sesamum radiatum TaxID=300843 RepID=A0AAW2PXZ3_SESRA
MDPKFGGKPVYGSPYAPGRTDLDQMPDTPTRGAHHRRAHSETFFRFPDLDDILLDDVVADFRPPPNPSFPLPHWAAAPVQQDRRDEAHGSFKELVGGCGFLRGAWNGRPVAGGGGGGSGSWA